MNERGTSKASAEFNAAISPAIHNFDNVTNGYLHKATEKGPRRTPNQLPDNEIERGELFCTEIIRMCPPTANSIMIAAIKRRDRRSPSPSRDMQQAAQSSYINAMDQIGNTTIDRKR